MQTSAALLLGLLLILSGGCLVTASSVMIIVFEQSDRTALIPEAIIYAEGTIAGKTDLNGAFNLSYEGLPPVLKVAKGGYTDWTGSPDVNDTAILVPLEIRSGILNVEIFDADSLIPVPEAVISLTSEDGTKKEERTGPDGRASISVRADLVYNLEISARNFGPLFDVIVTGPDTRNIQYSLVRSDRVSVKITDSVTENPIPGAMVQIDGTLYGGTNDRGVLITNLSRDEEHIFDISAEGYEPLRITRSISDVDQIVVIPVTKAKATVFVSVYSRDHQPLADADIRIDGVSYGVTNEFGRLMVSSLELKQYEFSASLDRYKTSSVVNTPGTETGEVILVLDRELSDLMVRVIGDDTVPVTDASVVLFRDGVYSGITGKTGSGGVAIVQISPDLPYLVQAEKEGYRANNTHIQAGASQADIIIFRTEGAGVSSSADSFLPAGLVLVVIIAGLVLGVIIMNKRRSSRKRGRPTRRKSL